MVDEASRDAVRITGTLNSEQYNGALKARDRVQLRGAGLTFNGDHHEIYLSDARRTAPAKLRTVLRQPVRPV